MQNRVIFLLSLCGYMAVYAANDVVISFNSAQAKKQHVTIALGYIEDTQGLMKSMVDKIRSDLTFSGQCSIDLSTYTKKPTEADIRKLFPHYSLIIFLMPSSSQIIEWRIFDTRTARMIDGREYALKGPHWRGWAHNIADQLWPLLTGQPPFFSSRLVFCKDVTGAKGKINKEIWVTDFDGSNPQRVVDSPTINVAPRWNHDKFNPLIFYSRYNNTNMQLVVLDRKRHHQLASDFDGSNMLPAFSDDGKTIVYCVARGDGECHLYHYEKGSFKKLTHNDGHNVSPTIAGSIVYFCSDFETNKPQIYAYSIDTKKTERITQGGYCASPRYSTASNLLLYTKMIDGTMQLMQYDPKTKLHKQLTSDPGNKEECSWSPCGNYIAYSVNRGTHKQIVLLNRMSHDKKVLTQPDCYCGYPDWSPLYVEFPIFA